MSEDLKKLYHQLILGRQKDPCGFEKRPQADFILEAYNPHCGDQFKLYLDLEHGRISQASYHGYGCALSRVSTSLLVEKLPGLTLKQAIEQVEQYLKALEQDDPASSDLIGALRLAKNFPGRQQCVELSWLEMKKFLHSRMEL